ncbi:MAG: hypothetical protein N2B06_07295, partial [Clostridium sp.]
VTSFMIKPIAKNKNIFKRFVLYLVVGNFHIINVVFILAYLNIFNRLALIITLLFTTVFIRIILDKKDAKRIYLESKDTIKHLLHGEYGTKLFLQRKLLSIRLSIKYFCTELFKGKKLEWIIFLTIMCYNIYYYSNNSINFFSFGAPDEEVHLYWIQSLVSGNIFPSGVYPHGFHNILGAITVLMGFNAVTVIKSFGVISMVLIMTMLYFGLRKILTSKYAALFGVTAYSLLNIYDIESIYRFQFAIPQEYGMIMLMPMVIFLFSYLKDKRISNLVLFGMCFSMTISIHFYITIIALVLCISIGIVYFYRILKNKLLMKIILCGILSAVVAIAPLAVGYARVHKIEQSMDWAVRVIQGKEYGSPDETEEPNKVEEIKQPFNWNSFLVDSKAEITKFVVLDIRVMYIFLTLLALTILYSILCIVLRKTKDENLYQLSFANFGLLLIFLILCRILNLPTVMEPKRVAIFFAYFSPIFIAMPFEVLYRVSGKGKIKKICSSVTFIAIPALILLIIKFGILRPLPPFYYFQTKGAMLVDIDIMKKYNDHNWTIVSPVNDTSVIQNNGYHYELSDFIFEQENWNEDIEIRIPTKYAFIYIEKRPIVLYGNRFHKDDEAIINRDMITYEDAEKALDKNNEDNVNYKENRNILMAKAYYWAEEYKKYFPKEMSVYYEDSELVVYIIVQNEYALNNFSINYGANEKSDK